jgi:osmotically-inducible protein OsmY
MRTALRLPLAFALGFATAYFLDPRHGKRRRHVLRDRALRQLRRGSRSATRRSRYRADQAKGLVAEATSVVAREEAVDDATVRQRILSDALRSLPVAASDVRVDVSDGVASLRGVVASHTLADDLVARVREVPGVRGVSSAVAVAGEPPLDG